VEESIWKKEVRKDASAKDLGPCHRVERGVYTKKREGILTIERRKRGSTKICGRPTEKRIYLTLQVTPNVASTLCGEKEWHTEDSTGLSISKPVDSKKWIPFTPHRRHIGWSRKKEDVYEVGLKMGI